MFEKVRDMLAKQLNLKPEQITPQSDVVKDLGADSLDVVELLISLEDDYGISIPEDDIVNVKTVQDIVDMIEKLEK
ncbi:MAG TPA: acyl carrier protein [Candidatus Borkfalkia faecigallinarum]|uniref:Acyl carrier protein n=1 Tax=Candidatus Borkfalkia faecigallinarum TaxID=2838509 RepID=A0A9D1VUP4_9FIRM|nr:acyl carrier protein [Candidatus Borkfalkia faecigallinarum]